MAKREVSDREKSNVYEAVVRYSLRRAPLARHSKLYVYINSGAPPELGARFPDYSVHIESGSAGSSPPRERWYFIVLGTVTDDRAFVTLYTAGSAMFLELAKAGEHWIVTDESPAIT